MQIEIWSIGKKNDPFIDTGLQYYFEKLKHFCNIQLHILMPKKNHLKEDINKIKDVEAKLVLQHLSKDHILVLLDERGKQLDSPGFSKTIQYYENSGCKRLIFLIGGAYGVSDDIFKSADAVISLSKLVFPHQLVRLILAEQIYRAYSIKHHLPYHHI